VARPLRHALLALGLLALAVFVGFEAQWVQSVERLGFDFRANTWQPAKDVLAGVDPYADPSVPGLQPLCVYPPLAFLVAVPLALLALPSAWLIWASVLLASAIGTVRVLGVRDWRVYAIYGASAPVTVSVLWGNLTILVTFLVAVVWRYRNRSWSGYVLAAASFSKLLVSPLVAWFLLKRHPGIALRAIVATPALIVGSWAVIGFAGMTRYPETLSVAADAYGKQGQGLQPFVHQLGFGQLTAFFVGGAVALALFALAIRTEDEVASFTFAIAATLAVAPLSWIYYFSLFVIPLAVRFPRLCAAWWMFGGLWVYSAYLPLRDSPVALSFGVLLIEVALVTMVWRQSGISSAASQPHGRLSGWIGQWRSAPSPAPERSGPVRA